MLAYIFIVNEENWEIVKKENVMGIGGRFGERIFQKLQVEDRCIIYVRGISIIGGLFSIKKLNQIPKIKWKTGNYSDIFYITPIKIPKEPISIKKFIHNLSFITNKKKWFTHFQHAHSIPMKDFELILSDISKS